MTGLKHLTVVSAGLSTPSSSRLLADRLADATVRCLAEDGVEAKVTVIELRDHAHDVVNNLLTGFPSPALRAAVEAVTSADGLIVVTPVFTASYSGLFKSFIDVLDTKSLTDLPVLLAATGGTERHSLVTDYAMRPLFTHLRARPLSTAVYAASTDWGSPAGSAQLGTRIERAASELATTIRGGSRESADPWALTKSFSELIEG